jgi:hypothetical protein
MSRVVESPEQEFACLQRALGLDPYHSEARRRFGQLQVAQAPTLSTNPPIKQVASAHAEAPARQRATAETPRIIPDGVPLKKVRHRRKRGTWFYVGITGSILLSLSASYFVLLVLGSDVPLRLRGLLGGTPAVTEVNGVPLDQVPDAVFKIPPSYTNEVTQAEPQAEILEPGIVHEHTFRANAGEEIAIGIQFFSPTAQRVNRNIALLDPQGTDAAQRCDRDRIIQGDNGAVITCHIDRSGVWQVRILGRMGESSGAYVVSIGRLMG